jgi:hypothetical protein
LCISKDAFDDAEIIGGEIILLQTFKEILHDICGRKSKLLKKILKDKPNSDILPLTDDDIDLLAERFEIGKYVYISHNLFT